jgi:hypothetical protein
VVGGGDDEVIKATPDCPEEGGQGRRHQVRTGKLGEGAQAAVVELEEMGEGIGALSSPRTRPARRRESRGGSAPGRPVQGDHSPVPPSSTTSSHARTMKSGTI